MFMSAMEATVVGTAMPTIIADLGGIDVYGWVGACYLLAATVSVPVYGKIADLFGRKNILQFGTALFLVGSVASGFANNIWILIIARTIQGLGAGAMGPIVMTVIGDIFTLEERGKIQGVFGAVWAIAGIAGPLLGGTIVHDWSWPWVFWINVPFGIASMWILARAFREPPAQREKHPLDWAGALVLVLGSLALLLGASREYPWITLPLSALFYAAFVVIELRAKDPVLPLPLLRGRLMFVANVAQALLGATMMGTLLYTPLYAQGVLGFSPTDAGATIAPMLVGWPLASAITTRLLVKIGFRSPVWLGSAIIAVSLGWFAYAISGRPSLFELQAAMFVYGFGMGLTNIALIISVQSVVEWGQRGVATAAALFARQMGGALGAGGLGAMLAAGLATRMAPEKVTELLHPHEGAAAAAARPEIAEALAAAMTPLFWICFVLGMINAFAVIFYPRSAVRSDTPATQ
jgi:EmrB/QacA subfamily drug resistance transporter